MNYAVAYKILERSFERQAYEENKKQTIEYCQWIKRWMDDHIEIAIIAIDELLKVEKQLHDEFSMDWDEIDELIANA